MSEWYYVHSGEKAGPVSEVSLRDLAREGVVGADTLVWEKSLSDWIRFDESAPGRDLVTCAATGAMRPKSEMLPYGDNWVLPEEKDRFVQSLHEGSGEVPLAWGDYEYIDPGRREKMAKGGMLFTAGVVFLWLVGCVIYGAYLGATDQLDRFDEQRLTVIGLFIIFPAFAVGHVFYFMWVYRVSKNAHVLRRGSMNQTPGWAVGFHLVPIVALWKPYVAVKEVWNASHGLDLGPGNKLLGWWWASWLIYNFTTGYLPAIGFPAGAAACIMAWIFMSRITRAQRARAGAPAAG